MTVISIPVSDERLAQLRIRAAQAGLTPEEFLRRRVDELLDEPAKPTRRMSMIELVDTLPKEPSPRCFATWEEYERHLQEEKDAWER